MAARYGSAKATGVATGTSAKTIAQLVAAANHAVRLQRVALGFHGVTNTHEPILVELVRQTTAGTSSALTPVALDTYAETLQTTARHTATVEPTTGDVLFAIAIHPQSGGSFDFPLDMPLIIPGGGRVGVRVTAANNINCDVTMLFEE